MKNFKLVIVAVLYTVVFLVGCNSEKKEPGYLLPPPPSTPGFTETPPQVEYFSKLIELYHNNRASQNIGPEIQQNPILLNACAIELCGAPAKYAPLQGLKSLSEEQLATHDIFYKETGIDQKVENLISEVLRRSQILTNSLPDLFAQKKTEKLDDNVRSVLTLMTLMNSVSAHGSEVVEFLNDGSMQVAPDKYSIAFPGLNAQQQAAAGALTNKFLQSPGFTNALYVSGQSFNTYIHFLAKNFIETGKAKDVDESLALIFSYYNQEILSLFQKFGALLFYQHDLSLLQKTKILDFSDHEKQAVMNLFYVINILQSTLSPSLANEALSLNFDLETLSRVSKFEQRIHENKNRVNSNEFIEAAKIKTLAHCKTTIGKALIASPSSSQQQESLKLASEVRAAALAAAKSYLSGKSLKQAEAALRAIEFLPPSNLEQTKLSLLRVLDSTTIRALSLGEDLTSTLQGNGRWDTLLLVSMLKSDASLDDEELLAPALSTCDSFKPVFFADEVSIQAKVINISWQSVIYPQIGAGVLAHELGHVVSFAIKDIIDGKELYAQVRRKSGELHALLERVESVKSHSYKEEDWADAFAHAALKFMDRSSPSHSNFACSLIALDPQNLGYQNLKFSSESADKHSTPLLRSLIGSLNAGAEIPESCDESLRLQIGPRASGTSLNP